jgi:hypothetical protein
LPSKEHLTMMTVLVVSRGQILLAFMGSVTRIVSKHPTMCSVTPTTKTIHPQWSIVLRLMNYGFPKAAGPQPG